MRPRGWMIVAPMLVATLLVAILLITMRGLTSSTPRPAAGPARSGAATLGATKLGLTKLGATTEPWRNPARTPDERARAATAAMTRDEKIALVHTHVGIPWGGRPKPTGAIGSAAIWPGVPRLGIPALQEADGSLGLANPLHVPQLYDVTALPAALATAATFDPALARAGGAVIGGQARAKGIGILLAGGANLVRDPRGGRTFEYFGEDPLLTGRMAGAAVAGIGTRGVISTLKHFALNDGENGRTVANAVLAEPAARESDLLAFELALEDGRPGAVMTGYNRVNGTHASQSAPLLATLKNDWHFPGFAMSDWGATHSTAAAALAGLDQQSGEEFDGAPWFGALLSQALASGAVPFGRLDDMVRRILASTFAAGLADDPPRAGTTFDREADAAIARRIAASSVVLLKNKADALPLRPGLRRIVVIGAHSDIGVLSGAGSSQVTPRGSQPFSAEQPRQATIGIKYYHPSAPVDAIARRAPGASVVFASGEDHAAAAAAARGADQVIVFAEQWLAEARDAPNLRLPGGQDDLIAAVADANPRTAVVLETGGAVTMPWLPRVPAVLEAWYPGSEGAEAIADVLFGTVDPSGRLPITFPQSESQLPRPTLPAADDKTSSPGGADTGGFDIDYDIEGADVGYRWFAGRRLMPLFPFGYGLSYTRFRYALPEVRVDGSLVRASVEVRNEGTREGTDTPLFFVEPEPAEAKAGSFVRRLAGWTRVTLRPGETRRVRVVIDPRLLARFDGAGHGWRITAGRYLMSVRPDAVASGPTRTFDLEDALLPP